MEWAIQACLILLVFAWDLCYCGARVYTDVYAGSLELSDVIFSMALLYRGERRHLGVRLELTNND